MKNWQGKLVLKNIELRNFRQFERISIPFHERLTVFIGVNGSGKTTVVDAVTKAMRIFAERVQRPDSVLDNIRKFYSTSDIRNGESESELEVQIQFTVNSDEKVKLTEQQKEEARQRFAQKEEEKDYYRQQAFYEIEKARLNYADNPIALKRLESDIQSDLNKHFEGIEAKFDDVGSNPDTEEIEWVVGIERNVSKKGFTNELTKIERIGMDIDWLRFGHSKPPKVSIPILVLYPCGLFNNSYEKGGVANYSEIFSAYTDAFDGQPVSLSGLTNWYRYEEGRARELGKSDLLKSVERAIYSLLSDENTTYNDLYVSVLDDPNGELVIDKNGVKLRITQLSSGERMLFLLVADLARRIAIATPGSDDPCSEGTGVVLIDEIDLHLHPKWQRTVIPKLMDLFPKVQFVVTTHSAQILSGLSDGDTVILRDKKARTLVTKTYGKDVNRILELIMGVPSRDEEVQAELDQYLSLIEQNQLEKAAELRESLEEKIGTDEPLFIRADGIIKRKELIGK